MTPAEPTRSERPDARSARPPGEAGRAAALFPDRLPPWIARSFGRIIVLIFLVVSVASVTVRIPETVRCPFVLLPAGGLAPVQCPVGGVIERACAREGAEVRKGETLFLIRSEEIRRCATELRTLEKDLAGWEAQLAALRLEAQTQKLADAAARQRLSLREKQLPLEIKQARECETISRQRHEAVLEIQQAQIEQYVSESAFRKKQAALYNDLLKRVRALKGSGAVSEMELLLRELASANASLEADLAQRALAAARLKDKKMAAERRYELAEERLKLQRLQTEHGQTLAALDKLKHDAKQGEAALAERRRSAETSMEKAQVRIAALRRRLADCEGDLKRVAAPFAGTVLRVARKTPGDVVAVGQELCQIARSDGELRAELTVPEGALAKLRPDQPVRLLLDAFPYQRYGTRRATVRWVSPGAVRSAGGSSFQAFAELIDKGITIEGTRRPFRPGMRGEARVAVGKRTLIEYVFEPLRRLRESMAEPEPDDDR